MLFAEADPLGGWAQVILQGGAFALLVYIVTVMYPRSVKEAREERVKREAEAIAERAKRDLTFTSLVDKLEENFRDRNNAVVEALKGQTTTVEHAMKEVAAEFAVSLSRHEMTRS